MAAPPRVGCGCNFKDPVSWVSNLIEGILECKWDGKIKKINEVSGGKTLYWIFTLGKKVAGKLLSEKQELVKNLN